MKETPGIRNCVPRPPAETLTFQGEVCRVVRRFARGTVVERPDGRRVTVPVGTLDDPHVAQLAADLGKRSRECLQWQKRAEVAEKALTALREELQATLNTLQKVKAALDSKHGGA